MYKKRIIVMDKMHEICLIARDKMYKQRIKARDDFVRLADSGYAIKLINCYADGGLIKLPRSLLGGELIRQDGKCINLNFFPEMLIAS